MKPPLRRDDLVYPELSYQLVGYAYEVFDELGPGHSEKTYHILINFTKQGVKFRRIININQSVNS